MKESDKNKKEMAVLEDSQQQIAFEVEDYLKKNYLLRYNMMTRMEECCKITSENDEKTRQNAVWQPLSDRLLNTIVHEKMRMGGNSWAVDIRRFIHSTLIPEYNPMQDYLQNLPPCNRHYDYIGSMARRIPTNFAHAETLFHRWFLAMVAQWLGMNRNHGNAVVLMLIGNQGQFKSTFCKLILPPCLREYYIDDIKMESSEQVERMLCRMALVNIDEYPGSMPGTASINETFPGNPETTTGAYVNRGQAQYMYERPKPEDPYKQTAVLVEIEIQPTNEQLYDPRPGANNTYWYKIEVLDDNGSYVPFLRNIVYTLRIKGLEDYGATTAQAAFEGPYFGNISASLETAGLSDLSNGTSAIHVDQLDYTFMTLTEAELESGFDLTNPDGSPSLFYFTPDVEHPDQIFFEDVENVVDVTVTKRAVTGFAHAVANFTTLPAGNDAGKIHITPAEIDVANGTMKKSVLRVAGKALPDGKELYREITITLMPKPDLKYGTGEEAIWTDILYGEGLTPTDVSGVNKDVYLRICLPVGLGASLFPIQIRIEAENNTLTSTSPNLPVRTGKTMFEPAPTDPSQPDTRRNTYFFVYTINYSDYCKLNPRTKKYVYKYKFGETTNDRIILKTSTSGSNATRISISDLEGHFNEKILDLTSTP